VNAGPTFVAQVEAAKPMQPRQRAFHNPPRATEPAAMRRAALRELGIDPAAMQRVAVRLRIVAPVALNQRRFARGATRTAAERRNRVDQRQQLGDVVAVGGGQDRRQRDASRLGENVVFRPRLTAIGWVRSTFFPPCTARTDELSATTREKSSLSAPRSLSSSTRCSLRHTPAFCQARTRRQQVMPEPHPISCGSISHGIPDCKTNRMPVSTRRSSSGLRPGCVLRRRLTGSSGWTTSHSSSSTSSRAILPRHDNYRRVAMTIKIPFC
jgi:hypothetical protein